MHPQKVKNFENSHPGIPMPVVSQVEPNECNRLKAAIAGCIDLERDSDPVDMLQRLRERAEVVPDIDASKEGFALKDALSTLGVDPSDDVYINWYRFDDIDKIALDDLARYWDDLWYPGADDIEVCDMSCGWILMVTHDGAVSFIRLGCSATGDPAV